MAGHDDAIEDTSGSARLDTAGAVIAQLVEATSDYELLTPESAAGLGL